MKLQNLSRLVCVGSFNRLIAALALVAPVISVPIPAAHAAITWDSQELTMESNPAGSGTQWWFDPFNWSLQTPADAPPYFLPPSNDGGTAAQDTQINSGTSTLPGGQGVVYDPANDPSFAAAGSLTYPAGFGPQIIQELYLSRQTIVAENLLTIKGDLTLQANMQLGRSSNTVGLVPTGRVNQLSGTVLVNQNSMDIAATDTSGNVTGENYGSGVYDYRGGTLQVSLNSGSGIRLSPSSSTVGAAGVGRFIMHNPSTPGHVRTLDYNAAAGAGIFLRLADGVNTGVGISEFHFENGGTRPIQVNRNLIINNGLITTGTGAGGIRSARLDLVLDAAPTVDINGVPQHLGLFDVNFANGAGNSTTGAGDLGDFFSSVDGSTLYGQGATVSATFGEAIYNWTISYTGSITWADPNAGTLASISGIGGVDVVLMGLGSVLPEGLPGDHNEDGFVNAADYVAWRKIPSEFGGDPGGYNLWRQNFGESDGGSGGSGQVPEPASFIFVLVGVAAVACRRQR